MKYLFTTLLLLLILLTESSIAQHRINYYPDSIRIELPDQHTLLVFEMRWYSENTEFIKNFPAAFGELMDYVKKSTADDFSETGPYKISVKVMAAGYKEIVGVPSNYSFKPIGEKTTITIDTASRTKTEVLIRDNQITELLPPGWEVIILAHDHKIKIYSESFEGLMSIVNTDLSEVSTKLESDIGMKNIGRKSVRAQMILKQNAVETSSINYVHPGDNIFLTANAGVGLFQDKLYPELSLKLGLTFRDHFNRKNIRTSVHYNNLFFAEKGDEGYNSYINSFLSVSFERNFSHKDNHAQWSGLGAGLLVRNRGNYFKGNTAKFFITHELGGRLHLVPEFYLTDDFKKFSFGMTLKYTF